MEKKIDKKIELEKGHAMFHPYSYDHIAPALLSGYETADKVCKNLYDIISKYENQLDTEFDVGITLVSMGEANKFVIESIGWIGTALIEFIGHVEGIECKKIRLVQHITQLNILLFTVPKDPSRPRQTVKLKVWDEQNTSGQA